LFQDGDLELLEDYDEDIAFYEVFETSDGSDDLKSSSVSTMCMNLSFQVKSDRVMLLLMASR